MATIVKGFFDGFCIAVLAGLTVSVLWFIGAMIVNFWKIYCKKKPIKKKPIKKKPIKKKLVKNCQHPNTVYTENHPDKVWTCCDCGESV